MAEKDQVVKEIWEETMPFKLSAQGSSHCGTAETNRTSVHEDAGLIPGLAQRVMDPALPGVVG